VGTKGENLRVKILLASLRNKGKEKRAKWKGRVNNKGRRRRPLFPDIKGFEVKKEANANEAQQEHHRGMGGKKDTSKIHPELNGKGHTVLQKPRET